MQRLRYQPMHPKVWKRSFPTGPEMSFEPKWDGHRRLIDVGASALRVHEKQGGIVTGRDPGLDAGVRAFMNGHSGYLDAELVAFQTGSTGPRQNRNLVTSRAAAKLLIIFDILEFDGERVTALPLAQRRDILQQSCDGAASRTVQLIDWYGPDDLSALWQSAHEAGYEGVVAKDTRSVYVPDGTRDSWLKSRYEYFADPLSVNT